uniref:F-box domain-containing protein n=1 Tax=Ditylenchus dipsaci TaxID=166011 RepID=A0A915E059_9BILA
MSGYRTETAATRRNTPEISYFTISAEILSELLSFLERSELDYLEFTSKYFHHFITKYFSNFPFNSLDQLDIYENSSHELSFRNFCLEQLQHYRKSGKWIVELLYVSLPIPECLESAGWKQEVDSISSLRRNSRCVIQVHPRTVPSLLKMLQWPTVFTCSYLALDLCYVSSFVHVNLHYVLCSTTLLR